jgi:hypothetical protein
MAINRRSRSKTNEENTDVTTHTETPDFTDVDVDAPAPAAEDTVAVPVEGETKTETKETKSTRPAVPEGKVSPVQFAKILSEHKTKQAREQDPNAAEVVVAPQVVYSYIKNNGPQSKNPFPAEPAEGRAAVVDAQAAIAWWDAKDARVAATKQAAAEKAAKKAEKAKGGEGGNATPAETTPAPELVEAE